MFDVKNRVCKQMSDFLQDAPEENVQEETTEDRRRNFFRRKAAEKLLYSKFYIIMAGGFAFGAFLIAIYIYNTLGKGYSINVIKSPILMVMLFLPFVPSCFLAMLWKKRRAEAIEILEPFYPTITAEDLRLLKDEV